MSRTTAFLAVAFTGGIAAGIVGAVITRPGIGVSPDSIVYMAAAQSITEGHGITMPAANGQDVPLTHFPPGYPLALAFTAFFFAHHFLLAAKALNILLFGANTALVAGWVYRRTRRLSLAAFSLVISIFALDFLRIYSMAWSEPLFLFLTFGGLLFLDFYIEVPSPLVGEGKGLLLLAALFSAAAVLTRYAGIAGICAGLLAVFFCQKKRLRQKLKESTLFGFVAGLPIALWLWRNFLLTHDATTRKFVFHPVLGQIRLAAQSTLSLWLFQGQLPIAWTSWVGTVIVLVFGFLWLRYKKPSLSPHFLLPLLFLLSYTILMVAIILFVEAQLLVPDEYDRILCPLHVVFLIAFLAAVPEGVWPRIVRNVFGLTAIGASFFFVYASAGTISEFAQEGQQFANTSWKTSPTLEVVRHIAPTMHVYTNGRMPIYLYLHRPCFEIPPKVLLSSLQPNPDYQKVMKKIAEEVRQGIAVVVDFFDRRSAPVPDVGRMANAVASFTAKNR